MNTHPEVLSVVRSFIDSKGHNAHIHLYDGDMVLCEYAYKQGVPVYRFDWCYQTKCKKSKFVPH